MIYYLVTSYFFLLPIIAMAQENKGMLTEPAKELPLPSTVSPELRRFIAGPVAPIEAMPTTAEGWRTLQKEADAEATKIALAAAAFVGVKIGPTKIADVPCFWITPKDVPAENKARLIVHVHGGAFVFNAGVAGTGEGSLLADACKTRVLSIDYRMPPDHPFPAASDDVLAVWKALVADHDPKKTAMAGTSAGGGLILTTMLRLEGGDVLRPAAMFIGTPAADLTKNGDSVYLNAEVDNLLGRYEGRIEACMKSYASGRDLKEPLLSPLNGDFAGFPPTILISGTRDLLLSNTIRVHRKLRSAGVEADLHVYEGQSHAMYLTSFPSPESCDALGEIAKFFDRYLKR
jgi:epsilon-lactone hydrolase